MSITLQDFATGDTNYVAKLNSNSDVIEAAIDALQALTGGAALTTLTLSAAYEALFGTLVAVIGDGSYVATDAGGSPTGDLNVTSGYCYRPTLGVVSKATSTTLSFNGQSAATYYVVVDSTGAPTRTTDSTEAIYSVVWTGSAFGAITRLANVTWGAQDWLDAQSSSALGHSYTSLDDRLEAAESAAAALTTAQAPNTVLAGPVPGSPTNAPPTFRALVATDLPVMVGDSGSGGTKGAVPAPSAGDAAAGKFLKADGTFAVPAGTSLGTVTSVNITQPAAGITASGGPVTSSGSITLALANDLAALEGLSSTGFAKRTGSDAWSLVSNISASDFAAQDSNLVLAGPAAGSPTTGAPTFRALVYNDLPAGMVGKPRVDAHTYASSVTLDCSAYDVFEITLTGNISIAFSGAVDGQRIAVRLTQDGTGSRLVTWDSAVGFGTDIATAVATTTASKVDYFGLVYNSAASKYHMVAVARGY